MDIPTISKKKSTVFETEDKDVISFLRKLEENSYYYDVVDGILELLDTIYEGLRITIKDISSKRKSSPEKKQLLMDYKEAYFRPTFLSRLLTIASTIPFNEFMELKSHDLNILLITSKDSILEIYNNILEGVINYSEYN